MSDWLNNVIKNVTSTVTGREDDSTRRSTGGCHVYAILVMRHWDTNSSCRLSAEYDFSTIPSYMAKLATELTDFVARTCSSEAKPNQTKGVAMDNDMGTFYIRSTSSLPPNQLVYIIAVNKECTRYQAFKILSEVIQVYKAPITSGYKDNIGNDLKSAVLRDIMNKYKGQKDKLLEAQSKLDETKQIVMDTFDSLIARQGDLDDLIAKSQDMSHSTARLMRDAKRRNSCCNIM